MLCGHGPWWLERTRPVQGQVPRFSKCSLSCGVSVRGRCCWRRASSASALDSSRRHASIRSLTRERQGGAQVPPRGSAARPARLRSGHAQQPAAIARVLRRGQTQSCSTAATTAWIPGRIERSKKGIDYRLVDLNPADVHAVDGAPIDHLLACAMITGAGIFAPVVGA